MARPTKEQQQEKKAAEQAAQQQPTLDALNEIKELLKQATQAPAFTPADVMRMQARDYITIEEAAYLWDIPINEVKMMIYRFETAPYKGKNGKIYVEKKSLRYAFIGESLSVRQAQQLFQG